jgi:hypothetical protein
MLKDLDISKGIKPEVPAEISKEPEQTMKEASPAVGDSPPAKRRRGRPRRSDVLLSPSALTDGGKQETGTTHDDSSAMPASAINSGATATPTHSSSLDVVHSILPVDVNKTEIGSEIKPSSSVAVSEGSAAKEVGTPVQSVHDLAASGAPNLPARGRKSQTGETPRRRGRKPKFLTSSVDDCSLDPSGAVGSGGADTSLHQPQGNMPSSQATNVAGLKDLVTVEVDKSLPEIGTDISPSVHEGNIGVMVTTHMAKEIHAGTLAPDPLNENVGLVQVTSAPAMPMVSEGSLQTSHVAVANKPTEKQPAARRRRKKTSGNEDTGVSTRRSAMKKSDHSTNVASGEVGSDVTPSEKPRIVKVPDSSSLQDGSSELLNINSSLCEKSGYDSQPSTPIAVPINEATLPSDFSDTHAAHCELTARESDNPAVQGKPVDLHFETPVVSQDQAQNNAGKYHTVVSSGAPASNVEMIAVNPASGHKQASAQIEPSASLLQSSDKDRTLLPSEVYSAASNKAPGRRRKGSAREPRTSSSGTVACERRAQLAGPKETDAIKGIEVSTSPAATVCVSSTEQLGTVIRSELTTTSAGEVQKAPGNHESSNISIQVGSHASSDISVPVGSRVSDAAHTDERSATMITHTPVMAESEERKLLGDEVQGIVSFTPYSCWSR